MNFPAVIKLENIGDDQYWARHTRSQLAYKNRVRRPPAYVAALGWDGSDIVKTFLRGQRDYSDANGVGSRGVCTYYILTEGYVYEVHQHLTWKRSRTYWCRIENSDITEMTFTEALAWLINAISELTSSKPQTSV